MPRIEDIDIRYYSSNRLKQTKQKRYKRKKRLFVTSIIGVLFNFIFGTLLHFTFNWFNCWLPFGFLMPINEAVWEHLKMVYWPIIVYSFIEYYHIQDIISKQSFIVAKFANITIGFGIIFTIFYTYTIWLTHNLIIDILTFYAAINIGQITQYFLFLNDRKQNKCFAINALFMIIVYGILFFIFTYEPPRNIPHIDIFVDFRTGEYGIYCAV